MPVGAYGGRADIMGIVSPDGPVYQAGTLSANPVTLAAGIAALKQLLAPGFYQELEAKTVYLTSKLNDVFIKNKVDMQVISIASIFWLKFTKNRIFTADEIESTMPEKFKLVHHELLNRGIYFGPSGYEVGFISASHTYEELDHLIAAFDGITYDYQNVLA
jgi:glutamate-1-semialdehyde 2,1-aminomutase